MGIGTAFAVYFIIWWLVLFIVLPFGLKTQDEDDDVTLGTVPSAPRGLHMVRAIAITTVVSALVFSVYFVSTTYWGIGFHSLPNLMGR